jgi:hypothetical protein
MQHSSHIHFANATNLYLPHHSRNVVQPRQLARTGRQSYSNWPRPLRKAQTMITGSLSRLLGVSEKFVAAGKIKHFTRRLQRASHSLSKRIESMDRLLQRVISTCVLFHCPLVVPGSGSSLLLELQSVNSSCAFEWRHHGDHQGSLRLSLNSRTRRIYKRLSVKSALALLCRMPYLSKPRDERV